MGLLFNGMVVLRGFVKVPDIVVLKNKPILELSMIFCPQLLGVRAYFLIQAIELGVLYIKAGQNY